MTELEKIKNIEEQINLAGLLPGVDLGCLLPEKSVKLKRAALNLYRTCPLFQGRRRSRDERDRQRHTVATQRFTGAVAEAMALGANPRILAGVQKSLRSIRATVIRRSRRTRFPTEILSGNWAIRR
jgi:hypothetical protein